MTVSLHKTALVNFPMATTVHWNPRLFSYFTHALNVVFNTVKWLLFSVSNPWWCPQNFTCRTEKGEKMMILGDAGKHNLVFKTVIFENSLQ